MLKHPDDHAVTSCLGKAAYESYDVANEVASRKHKRRGKPYKCVYCNKWHAGRGKPINRTRKNRL